MDEAQRVAHEKQLGKECYAMLEKLENRPCLTSSDASNITMEVLRAKVATDYYSGGFTLICYQYNCPEFRSRIYGLLRKLSDLKRTLSRDEKYAVRKKKHLQSGFEEVCTEILYRPGGEGFRASQQNFADNLVALKV